MLLTAHFVSVFVPGHAKPSCPKLSEYVLAALHLSVLVRVSFAPSIQIHLHVLLESANDQFAQMLRALVPTAAVQLFDLDFGLAASFLDLGILGLDVFKLHSLHLDY